MGWGPCWLASLQLASLQLWWLIGIGLDMGRWIACGHYLWLPSLHQYSSFSFSFWHLCAIMPLNRTLRSWLYYGNQFWTRFLGLLTKTRRLSCLSDSCLEVVLQGKFDSLLTESQNSLNTERLYLTWFFIFFSAEPDCSQLVSDLMGRTVSDYMVLSWKAPWLPAASLVFFTFCQHHANEGPVSVRRSPTGGTF